MSRYSRFATVASLAGLVALVSLGACGGDDGGGGGMTGPDPTGSVEVTTSTSGDAPDSDGYTVTLDGGDSRSVGTDGTVTFEDVATGEHTVELSGLDGPCVVDGDNPVTVQVSENSTAQASFGVTCDSSTGSVEATTSTSGDSPDPDGYTVALDGGSGRSIGTDDAVTFEDVATGEHTVELSGLDDPCVVDGDNPVTVQVSENSTAQASFGVTCDSQSGDLEVAVSTSDPDGVGPSDYTLTLDGSDSRTVGPNETVTFQDLGLGDHTLELTGLGDNCQVEGDNPRTVQVEAGANSEQMDVSCAAPVSNVILFSSMRDGNWEIYLMNEDGSDPQNLTTNSAKDIRPMTSRDGSRIAFVSNRDGEEDVWTMLPDGSALQNLTETSSASDDRPSWFPGADSLAFVSTRDGNEEIYVMDADGSNATRITNNNSLDTHPAVSPDGSQIAFTSDRDGNEEIYVMDADGTNVDRLTNDAGADRRPVWSPDGSQIAFFTDRDGDFEIYVMDADGTNPTNLTNAPGATDQEPAFSPDGSQIAFASDRDGSLDIFVMDADGTNPTNLTSGSGAADEDPAWDN